MNDLITKVALLSGASRNTTRLAIKRVEAGDKETHLNHHLLKNLMVKAYKEMAKETLDKAEKLENA